MNNVQATSSTSELANHGAHFVDRGIVIDRLIQLCAFNFVETVWGRTTCVCAAQVSRYFWLDISKGCHRSVSQEKRSDPVRNTKVRNWMLRNRKCSDVKRRGCIFVMNDISSLLNSQHSIFV